MYVLGEMLIPDSRAEFWGKLLLLEMNGLNVRQGERTNMK